MLCSAAPYITRQASNETISQHLMASGFTWTTRGGIENNTAADDFAAFIGLARGQAGSAVFATWQAGELIVDPYSEAASGQKVLTLTALVDFKLVRPSSYKRIKFVA